MHPFFVILAVISSLSSLASAASRLYVFNNCTFPVYPWGFDPVPPSENAHLPPFQEEFYVMWPRPMGNSIKVTTGLWDGVPRIAFTYDGGTNGMFYVLNNEFGDPFEYFPVTATPLNPTGPRCDPIHWPNGLNPGGHTPVRTCPLNTNFRLTLCGTG